MATKALVASRLHECCALAIRSTACEQAASNVEEQTNEMFKEEANGVIGLLRNLEHAKGHPHDLTAWSSWQYDRTLRKKFGYGPPAPVPHLLSKIL